MLGPGDRIGLHGHDLLVDGIGDVHHCILVTVQRYQAGSSGVEQTNLNVCVSQPGTEVIETDSDEVSFAPIVNQGLGSIIVVFQGSEDRSPVRGYRQAALNVSNRRSPIRP